MPGDYLLELPANPKDAPPEVLRLCFTDGILAQPLYDLAELVEVARQIPMRSTHGKAGKVMESSNGMDAFWNGFRNMFLGSVGMHVGQTQWCNGGGQVPLTFATPQQQPQPRANQGLVQLLDRAVTQPGSSVSPGHQAQLALPAPPTVPALQAPQQTPAAVEPVLGETSEKQTVPSITLTEDAKQVCEKEDGKTSSCEKEGGKTSLSESVEKLQAMRKEPVSSLPLKRKHADDDGDCEAERSVQGNSKAKAKKVAARTDEQKKEKQMVPKSKATPKSKAAPKQAEAKASKKPAPKAKAKMSKEQRADEKKRILKTVPKALVLKYSQGCSTCRWVANCTLSCWRKRGFM